MQVSAIFSGLRYLLHKLTSWNTCKGGRKGSKVSSDFHPQYTHSLSFSYTHSPPTHTCFAFLRERVLIALEHLACPSLLILQLMIRSFKSDRAFLCLRILLWLSITYLYSTYEFRDPTPPGLVSSFSILLFPFHWAYSLPILGLNNFSSSNTVLSVTDRALECPVVSSEFSVFLSQGTCHNYNLLMTWLVFSIRL